MRNTKRRLEPLSFFDHTGISAHLEKMAAKGWRLEKITNTGWVYRRSEPKKLHYAVSYYPKASEFDPEPSDEQKTFHDFCAHTGWQLVCTSAQMQIFYNEQDDPIPIETDPELELEAIHASAKKSFIPSYSLLAGIGFLSGALWLSILFGDPVELLSSSTQLVTGFMWLIMLAICAVELITYFCWYNKAVAAAEQGIFKKVPSTSKFQIIAFVLAVTCLIVWAANYIVAGNGLQRWIALIMAVYMPTLIIGVNAVKEFLKRRKASRSLNRTLTMIISFVAAFLMTGIIIYGTVYASTHGMFKGEEEETYEHNGITWVIHRDEIPLTVSDLTGFEYDGYIKERRGEESFIMGYYFVSQHPRFDAENYKDIPWLEYTLNIVKIPALYDVVKERVIYENEELNGYKLVKEDAADWGADEAYKFIPDRLGADDVYVLCYSGTIVEISLDWEPTPEHKAIVGEKLGK